ncbi:protein kinase C-binding protein 1 isoform X2 [Ceratina calcarata]|uniref:Protein kinase C-binding protein 1 isoform X2 n=1 Tax=Ceratina calcarata TaxID=156304 RepID=A0AAJ7S7Y7_9HYME|nr:protein kinase C-binding protein 1 isoform X2 [Ceratina calcarata]
MQSIKMTSVEVQKTIVNSSQLESSVVSESQEIVESVINKEEQESIENVNKKKSKTTIKDNSNSAMQGGNEQNKNKSEDVIILDYDEVTCNINKTECEKNTGKLEIISSASESDPKMIRNEKKKESPPKSENALRRTRRSLVVQEGDLSSEDNSPRSKRKKKNTIDRFCWRCHKESVEAHCSACPRSWHRKCIGMQQSTIHNWICGECAAILRADNAETRSTAMSQLSIDQLCLLLKHVVSRMKEQSGSEPFWKPVELSDAPNYLDYVVKPMDLSLLESNVKAKLYGSTDAFMADAKWIQHNCIVFNTCGGVYTDTSRLTNAAKQIIKFARQEVSEIEACPDCYAHSRNLPRPQPSWFIEPCRRPHPLVWAKLKGFPFWPAKAMPRVNTQGFVDVRFFGEHDRAWVPPRDLYLYSEEPPVPLPRKRKLDMEECVQEITRHCRKLELVFGQFKFAPPRVQYNPHDPTQIKLMLPNYDLDQPINCTSPEIISWKYNTVLKKRPHVKTRTQSDSEKADNSDIENKVSDETNLGKEQNKAENKQLEVRESNNLHAFDSITMPISDTSELVEKPSKESMQNDKKESEAGQENTKEEEIKPSTSKTTTTTTTTTASSATNNLTGKDSNATKQSTNGSNYVTEGNNNIENVMIRDTKSAGNLLKQEKSPIISVRNDVKASKKESPIKYKGNVSKISITSQKNNLKGVKNVGKIYKPKTRIVDKVNAEHVLRSIVNEQSKKVKTPTKISVKQNNSLKDNAKIHINSPTVSIKSVPTDKVEMDNDISDDIKNDNVNGHKKSATDQPAYLFFVRTDGIRNMKKSTGNLISDKEKNKESSYDQIKESKARKTFSNKSRNCPQLIPNALSTTMDAAVSYVPTTHEIENRVEYNMLPPEAGPISARLYYDAQDLAKKMAKLMEEAYKEAAQESQHGESDNMSENHQATVHFLRLQIERMRWQHQQQLAELKHNTDRILKEMKASLEAERLRAIEETRRETEEEKQRCIDEIKRKQWCAVCRREALFYCCWNTAYCDYPCQQTHWPIHMRTCAQKPSFTTIVTSSTPNSNQQQVMPSLMINTQHVTTNMWRA